MSELKSERTGSVAPMASTSAASLLTSSMSSQGPSPGKMASPSAASLLSGSYYPPDRPAGDVPLYAWLLDQSRSQDAAEDDEPEPWIVGASKPVHPITGLGPRPGNQVRR